MKCPKNHQSSYTMRSRALAAQTLAHRSSNNRPVRQPRPRRLDNRNSIASITTSNPLGRELVCEYRTAGLPVKSFPSEEGGFRREVEPLLAGEDG